jgi:plasmid stabilization system protein ParE
MNYRLRFRPEVVTDLDDAAKWYDGRSTRLGADFLGECKAALDNIAENPERVTADSHGIRSSRIRRFPYVIHYRIEHTTVVVFAVMFGGRDPSAWLDRV